MDLQIRDVQTSDVFSVPASGQTFGRAGPKADIVVPDRTVSSKHARIYSEGGVWFLEDLRSSNGTFVEGERIDSPVRLTPGMRFAFCRYAYEVVASARVGAGAATSVLENAQITGGDPTVSGPGHPRAVEPHQGGPRRDPTSADGPRTYGNERTAAPQGDGGGFGYFMATVPKATGYYMAAVPLMLVNPIGFVRKGVAEPKFGAFGTKELIAYALPAVLLNAVLASIGGIVTTIVAGTFGFGTIVSPLISMAIAVVVAVVMGFIWHPLVRWWVRILKGESDEVSRTNYFIMTMTAYPIAGVAALLATIIGLIPVPFLGIIPSLVGIVGSLLLGFIGFSWYIHFRVMKWFPILLLIVLGGLTAVSGVLAAVGTIRADIAALGSGGSGGSDFADGDVLTGEALAAALASGDISPEEAAEMSRRAAAAAVAAANAAAGSAEAGDERAADAAVEAAGAAGSTATAAEAGVAAGAAAGTAAGAAAGTAAGAAAGTAAGTAAAPEPAPAAAVRPGTAPPPSDETSYERYVRRRAAVEVAIERDPMLMSRKDIQPLYKEMHKVTFKLQKKHKVKTGKKATPDKLAEKKIADKLRDAEVYQRTSKIVDTLYEKIIEGR